MENERKRRAEELENESRRRTEELEKWAELERERRETDRARRKAEEEKREEERKLRKLEEERKERMNNLSKFKLGGDLQLFLSQFQEIMEDCAVDEEKWNTTLYSKLSDELAERMQPMREEKLPFPWQKSRLHC